MARRRTLGILTIVLTLTALFTALNLPARVSAPSNPTILLVGFISAWNNKSTKPNPTIIVTQGDTVTIQLSSGDGAAHKFFIDIDKNADS